MSQSVALIPCTVETWGRSYVQHLVRQADLLDREGSPDEPYLVGAEMFATALRWFRGSLPRTLCDLPVRMNYPLVAEHLPECSVCFDGGDP